MEITQIAVEVLKIIVPVSIFFVWVVRYDNIVQEFKHYSLPVWIRDLVGITKLTCALMIAGSNLTLVKLGSIGIVVLMLVALLVHVKVKNPLPKMLPALTLMLMSLIILFST